MMIHESKIPAHLKEFFEPVTEEMGLEPTPAEYVARMVGVFEEVRRVLRGDGTLWLNIGDSYASGAGEVGRNDETPESLARRAAAYGTGMRKPDPAPRSERRIKVRHGLKPKDLCGIPWRLAFALQAAGWYLRSDIIWSKPNSMPESVTDRPSKSHEYVFLFSKKARYYYDGPAIAEAAIYADEKRAGAGRITYGGKRNGETGTGQESFVSIGQTRNKRTVWSIVSDPYPDAHFATFPPALVEPMVLAGTPAKGCCEACEAPWKRVTERSRRATRPGEKTKVHGRNSRANVSRDPAHRHEWDGKAVGNRDPQRHCTEVTTTGWEPGCACSAPAVGSIVLDPFCGTATVGQVAVCKGQRFIGIELNPEYVKLANARLAEPLGIGGLFDPKRIETDLFT